MLRRESVALLLGALLVVLAGPLLPARGTELGSEALRQVWERTDRPVREGRVSRAWVWGPAPITPLLREPGGAAPAAGAAGERWVQYFDKGRLEIPDPASGADAPGAVTAGLLALELITGQVQLGYRQPHAAPPAEIAIVGDADDPVVPTYATLNARLRDAPLPVGSPVRQVLDRAGRVTSDPALGALGVTAAVHIPETNHSIASVFWEYLHASGP
ncbi:MAG: hypothetical protein QJR03_05045, partial [Sphaerobacter sp.]|nr:hypothetical protein [Sphaerobacter sp.]